LAAENLKLAIVASGHELAVLVAQVALLWEVVQPERLAEEPFVAPE
jgi:hypothetical protein